MAALSCCSFRHASWYRTRCGGRQAGRYAHLCALAQNVALQLRKSAQKSGSLSQKDMYTKNNTAEFNSAVQKSFMLLRKIHAIAN